MIVNDPVGDLLARIRNALMRGRATVRSPSSKLRIAVLGTLEREGYIRGFQQIEGERGFPELEVGLKYHNGKPTIREVARISRPGRRVYVKAGRIPIVRSGLGIAIVSTPQGLMTDAEAQRANIGGEVLCRVF